MTTDAPASLDFIRQIVTADQASGKHGKRVVTRFPPEPNGYLHIGHAKSICLNFGIARDFGGVCHMRFDDTNPTKEEQEYVDSIMADVRWLGFDWDDKLFFASDYFSQMYGFAEELILKGLAYVDSLSAEEMRAYRGTPTEPGKDSPYRNRTIEENLDLFRRMRAGEFPDGTHVLRARIDMASPNLNMRDPALYRIRHASHHRTGDQWCVYPMYTFAHPLEDAIEQVTHSICTLEFEDQRPFYDWLVANTSVPAHPQQIEFARLNLTYTMMSKRHLLKMVQEGVVAGWDDPRMPTLSGYRRRGVPPAAIRAFVESVGVAKANSTVDLSHFDFFVREDLNRTANRVMAVLDPIKLVITNYPEDQVEEFDAENNPEDPSAGWRKVPFSRELYIERDDFREVPPPKYFRLSPGREIRLKHAYYVTCTGFVKGPDGEIAEVHCTYDPDSRGGTTTDGRVVRGTSHWVSARHAAKAEVRLYDRLFAKPQVMDEGETLQEALNPESLKVVEAWVEPGLASATPGARFQFLRTGYFAVDPDSTPGRPVFNRTITLRDTWAKEQRKA